MYHQTYDPVAHSLALSAIFAAAPLTVMFIMLGMLKRSPQLSALVSLLACVAVATLVYRTPLLTAVKFGLYGTAFSLLTVIWIILNAIWIYNLTVASGHFAVLRHSFARLSDDRRIQAILVALCFGALIEALAGAGTPIAIVSAMLVALGFDPRRALMLAPIDDPTFGRLAGPPTGLTETAR